MQLSCLELSTLNNPKRTSVLACSIKLGVTKRTSFCALPLLSIELNFQPVCSAKIVLCSVRISSMMSAVGVNVSYRPMYLFRGIDPRQLAVKPCTNQSSILTIGTWIQSHAAMEALKLGRVGKDSVVIRPKSREKNAKVANSQSRPIMGQCLLPTRDIMFLVTPSNNRLV